MDEFVREYKASLEDLSFNSKPVINTLTILADENKKFAAEVVMLLETRIKEGSQTVKLPCLYLLDSIVKNLAGSYPLLFETNLVETFTTVFQMADEKARKDMYKLRQTWKMVFPADILRALDVKTKEIDPNWPILKASSSSGKKPVATSKSTPAATANPAPATGPGVSKQLEAVPTASPAPITAPNSIHFNPKFFATASAADSNPDRNLKILQQKRAERQRLDDSSNAIVPTDDPRLARQEDQRQLIRDQQTTVTNSQPQSQDPRHMHNPTQPGYPGPEAMHRSGPHQHLPGPQQHPYPGLLPHHPGPQQHPPGPCQPHPDPQHRQHDPRYHEPGPNQPHPGPQYHDGAPQYNQHGPHPSHHPGPGPSHHELGPHHGHSPQRHKFGPRHPAVHDSSGPEVVPVEAAMMIGGHSNMAGAAHMTASVPTGHTRDDRAQAGGRPNHLPSQVPTDSMMERHVLMQDTPRQHPGQHPGFGRKKTNKRRKKNARDRFRPYDDHNRPGRLPYGHPPPGLANQPYPMPAIDNLPPAQGGGSPISNSQGSQSSGVDVHKLLLNLKNQDMLPTRSASVAELPKQIKPNSLQLPTIRIDDAEQLKRVYPAALEMLYTGQQCSSCGLRFTDERSKEYGQHLDWHFKRNQVSKENRTLSRAWLVPKEDWVSFVEGENVENKATSTVFEQESSCDEVEDDDTSCPVGSETNQDCVICREKLETFWNEDDYDGEWRYRGAVRVNGKLYHHQCLQDSGQVPDTPMTASTPSSDPLELHLDKEDVPLPPIALPGNGIPMDSGDAVPL